jgi:hypothetical protein
MVSGHSLSLPIVLLLGAATALLVGLGPGDGTQPTTAAKLLVDGDIFIPASAHVAGAAGTNWRTDAEVHNPGSTQATFTISLLRQDSNNSSPATVTRSLAPGQSLRLDDILQNLFAFDGSAALLISTTAGEIVVTSRTYNQVSVGTYGQFIGGVLERDAIRFGSHGRIVQLTHNRSSSTGSRTNLGFVNCTSSTITVMAEMYTAAGTRLGSVSYQLQPYMYTQKNRIFENVTSSDVADGYIVVSSTTSGAKFFAYASVVDNRTGDPVYIPAEVFSGTPSGPTPTPTPTTPPPTPTPTATPPTTQPNLTPYAPGPPDNWDAPLVPSDVTGTFTIGNLSATGSTYFDLAVINDSDITVQFAEGQAVMALSIDDWTNNFVAGPGGLELPGGFYANVIDVEVTGISAGEHQLGLTADPLDIVSESNENDNVYTRTATWGARTKGIDALRAVEIQITQDMVRPGPAADRSAVHAAGWTKTLATGPVYIAATAHVAGAAGTNWRTDLELHNPGTTAATYEIALLRADQANTSPATITRTVGPGQCLRLEDVLFAAFGYDGSAALRITPLGGAEVVVTSRTYNLTSSGTYGQFIGGAEASEAITSGEQGRLIQLTHNRASGSGYRTNIGFVNTSGGTIDVTVDLYTAGGAYLGSVTTTLQPYMYKQINKIFEAVTGGDVSDGYAVVRSGSGSFLCYASVVDNATGDPIFVPAVKLLGGPPPPTPTPTTGPGIQVSINPSEVTLAPGGSQQFTATVTGTTNTAVNWSVAEGAVGGNITATGFYTAPGVPGTYHVVAASQADLSRTGTATVNIVAQATGVVLGTVVSTSGSTLGDVEVSVGGRSATTNDQGYFTVTDVPATERAVVQFRRSGYVDAHEIAEVVQGLGTFLEARMAAHDAGLAMPAGQGGELSTPDGGYVSIGGGSLVDELGVTYDGTVDVSLTTFDPSDPEELAAFPGEFEGVTVGGATVPFVTFGFMDISVNASGDDPQALQLAPGRTATIRIPIPQDAQAEAPSTLPQWYFNPADGRWHEEGTFFRNGSYYEGQIDHFSVWNCDVAATRCFINGRVVDGDGQPVTGARVEFHSHRSGGGYVTSGETSTPASGRFRVPVDADATMTYWAQKGGIRSEVVGPVPTCADGVERDIGDIVLATVKGTIALTWGADPRDLDSHLAVPVGSGWRHVYYPDAGDGVIEGVSLDTDDTNSFGPEIFTIYALHDGTYRYSVHHYSGDGTISTSGATLNVILDGFGIYSFTPPPGAQEAKDVWRVFDMIVSGGQIIEVNTINDYLHGINSSGDESAFLP